MVLLPAILNDSTSACLDTCFVIPVLLPLPSRQPRMWHSGLDMDKSGREWF